MHPFLFTCVVLTAAACSSVAASTFYGAHNASKEVPHVRNYFYVGGQYVSDGANGTIHANQMYVERLSPVDGPTRRCPLVIIHGQAQTGTNWLNKPDGGRGWASYFLTQGFELYIVDQTFRGRSPWKPAAGAVEPSTYSAQIIQQRFTAPQDYDIWPQAKLHTQWPGNGTMGDAVFDAFYASNVQFINNATYQEATVQAAGAALLDRIGKPVILIGHSQGGLMPPLIADARPNLTEAIILIEPTGPPFQEAIFSTTPARPWGLTDIPITYSPPVTHPTTDLIKQTHPAPNANYTPCTLQASSPPPRQLVNLAPKPILFLGSEASYHVPYDYCTVAYYRQAGCGKLEFLRLPDVDVHGNGHMMFLERNSDVIAGLVVEWIDKLH